MGSKFATLINRKWHLTDTGIPIFRRMWRDKTITLFRMEMDFGISTQTIMRLAREMGLGKKATSRPRPKKQEPTPPPRNMIEAWPEDMGRFEDDERPIRNKRI